MNKTISTQVLIIGGGATGTGPARDLALRGVDCILIEKQDINAGASGGNHGLLHSGARYIASDPAAARECRDEGAIIKWLMVEKAASIDLPWENRLGPKYAEHLARGLQVEGARRGLADAIRPHLGQAEYVGLSRR